VVISTSGAPSYHFVSKPSILAHLAETCCRYSNIVWVIQPQCAYAVCFIDLMIFLCLFSKIPRLCPKTGRNCLSSLHDCFTDRH